MGRNTGHSQAGSGHPRVLAHVEGVVGLVVACCAVKCGLLKSTGSRHLSLSLSLLLLSHNDGLWKTCSLHLSKAQRKNGNQKTLFGLCDLCCVFATFHSHVHCLHRLCLANVKSRVGSAPPSSQTVDSSGRSYS